MTLPIESVPQEAIVMEQSRFNSETEFTPPEKLRRRLYERHRSMLIISAIVLTLSFALSIRATENESLVSIGDFDLPVVCTSRAWFGVECPGCGLTRSFVALAAGDISDSYRQHRLGWLLFGAVVLQIPYRSYRLWQLRRSTVEQRWPTYFGFLLIVALIGNWALKVFSL
jgi:hypothetical protein